MPQFSALDLSHTTGKRLYEQVEGWYKNMDRDVACKGDSNLSNNMNKTNYLTT